MSKKRLDEPGTSDVPAVRPEAPPPAYIPEGERLGLEKMRDRDIIFPRVILLQGLSPIVQVAESGMHAGDLINSVTLELIARAEEPRIFTPIMFWPEWIEWLPRNEGGGIVAISHDPASDLANRGQRGGRPRGVEGEPETSVLEYLVFLALFTDKPPSPESVVCFSCAKTNYKHGRRLLNLARMRGHFPLFAGSYEVVTTTEHNARVNADYWVLNFRNAGWASEEVYKMCAKIHDSAKDATVSAAPPEPDSEPATNDADLT